MPYYVNASDFTAHVADLSDKFPKDFTSETVFAGKLNLRQMRDNAEANLHGLLSALGYPAEANPTAALEDLNERIKEFHATTASFNGPRLRMEIINPLKGIIINDMQADLNNFQTLVQHKQAELGEVFLQLVDSIINEFQMDGRSPEEKEFLNDVAAEIYAQLNQTIFNFNTGAVSTPKHGGWHIKGEYKELTAQVIKKIKSGVERANFTGGVDPNIKQLIHKDPNFSRRLLLLAQSRGINVDGIYQQKVSTPIFEMADTNDELNIYFDILKPFTDVMSPSDSKGTKAEKAAQTYFTGLPSDKQKEEIEKLCARATDFLGRFFYIDNLPADRAEKLRSKFNQAIRDIITQYPGALFTGSNEQGVVGILGEIQGLYYIYSILGDLNPSIDPQTLVQWIGGDTGVGGGVKTGADLIVAIGEKLGYGIQIKNSMDLTDDTSFSDFSLGRGNVDKGFIQQLVDFGIDSSVVEMMEDIFMMKGFNIGYHLKGNKAVEGQALYGDVITYKTGYDQLLELVERANRYIALAAVMIMRIQYLEGQGFYQNNTLWIIGGTAMVSAVQILDNLIKQIDGELGRNAFKTSVTTRLGKESYTIVDYINGNTNSLNDLKTILKTSYNFHKSY